MKLKKISLSVLVILITALLMVPTIMAKEYVDPEIPESWNQKPKTASELDITEFNQAPEFEEKVSDGELPAVEERLPADPPVMEPYGDIGRYGGTVNSLDIDLSGSELGYWNNAGSIAPAPKDGSRVPFLLEDYQYNDDFTKITIFLREGLKWSDGETFNADDIMYWWEHEANNEYLEPVAPEKWDPPLLDVTRENEWEVTFHFGKSSPHFHLRIDWWDYKVPEHFMKDFHPEFIGEEQANQYADEAGLESWDDFYLRVKEDSPDHPEYDYQRPVLTPYVVTERSETNLVAERNPYFPFVDTEGNQLPYIKEINISLANEPEMAATKAATGDATFSARHLQTSDIPLYKKNEAQEDYTTLLFTRAYGSEAFIGPNVSHKDPRLRSIFGDVRFRKALSLSINREEINEKVYYGRATPMQATVTPNSAGYEERFAEAYAEYDPERAKELLDDMGMVDVDGDGYREGPDGEEFNPQFMYAKMGPVEPTSIFELVNSKWDEIGLDIDLQKVNRALSDERMMGNNFDISSWTFDGVAGPAFFINGVNKFAPVDPTPWVPWAGWVNWYNTDGEEGIEPPAKVKEMISWGETVKSSADEDKIMEAKKNLLEAQAENLWYIGTVGLAPQPIIVSNRLKNMPKKGYWGAFIGGYMDAFRTSQMYLESE